VNCKRCPNVDRLGEIAAGLGVPIERLLHVPQCLACADVPEPDRICAQCGTAGPGTPAVMVQAIEPERDDDARVASAGPPGLFDDAALAALFDEDGPGIAEAARQALP
jgi:hypothetical protein